MMAIVEDRYVGRVEIEHGPDDELECVRFRLGEEVVLEGEDWTDALTKLKRWKDHGTALRALARFDPEHLRRHVLDPLDESGHKDEATALEAVVTEARDNLRDHTERGGTNNG